ncbi:hypothetical protein OIO90_004580 [Microbotryomycetes sp. JL221]|nr:hypothetical protein OIO90_004580 [Microbotryomycetes sp. JL221]
MEQDTESHHHHHHLHWEPFVPAHDTETIQFFQHELDQICNITCSHEETILEQDESKRLRLIFFLIDSTFEMLGIHFLHTDSLYETSFSNSNSTHHQQQQHQSNVDCFWSLDHHQELQQSLLRSRQFFERKVGSIIRMKIGLQPILEQIHSIDDHHHDDQMSWIEIDETIQVLLNSERISNLKPVHPLKALFAVMFDSKMRRFEERIVHEMAKLVQYDHNWSIRLPTFLVDRILPIGLTQPLQSPDFVNETFQNMNVVEKMRSFVAGFYFIHARHGHSIVKSNTLMTCNWGWWPQFKIQQYEDVVDHHYHSPLVPFHLSPRQQRIYGGPSSRRASPNGSHHPGSDHGVDHDHEQAEMSFTDLLYS